MARTPGEPSDHLGGGPVGDDLSVGEHHHAVATSATSSTSCVARTTQCPSRGEVAQDRHEATLCGVVETSCRLIQQEQWRAAGEHDRERKAEPLPLREITRMLLVEHLGRQIRQDRSRRAGLGAGVAVGVTALGRN